MMKPANIKFNQRFLDLFSNDELQNIIGKSISFSADCIVISTDTHFCELSADMGDALEIYCDEHSNDTAKMLTKDEFMTLFQV